MKDKLDGGEETPMPDHADKAEAGRDEASGMTGSPPEEGRALEKPSELENAEFGRPDAGDESSSRAADGQPDLVLPVPGIADAAIEPDLDGEPIVRVEQFAPTEAIDEAPLELPIEPDIESGLPENESAADSELARPDEIAIESCEPEPESENERAEPLAAAALVPSGEPPKEEPELYEPRTEVAVLAELAADEPLVEAVPVETPPAEPAQDEPDLLASADVRPVAAASFEESVAEARHSEPETMDAPPAELTAEPPLRDRIPSVLPVELEAIKTPLAVPVFEPPPRPPEVQQPASSLLSRAPETAVATAAVAVAVPRDTVAVPTSGRSTQDLKPFFYRALRLAAKAAIALGCLVLMLIVLYRWVNPPASTLMLGQWLTGTRIDQRWVPIDRMSPYLQRAVITSEDGRFCQHRGVDWGEIEEAIERARDGVPRGGSTISMQVVKNLFLWPSKSYVRKALEIPLTYAIELVWPKRRILEIYLNVAEWGPGVFGAEAASRYHFGKPAASLTPSQAALLAASLPNPLERRAGAPGPGLQRLASTVHGRMMASPGNAACIQTRR